jgi:aquaporin Z
MNIKALGAEFVGTFLLVASILDAALFAFPNAGILGVALSVGFTVMATAYAIGHISGGHYNPAVTIGLTAAGKFSSSNVLGYIVAQCLGAIAAAFLLYTIASGKHGGFTAGNFGSNTYGGDGYSSMAVFLIEAVLTAFLMLVILGVTRKNGPSSFAPIAIGMTLAAIHIMAIPISNASVNPARSLAAALVAGPNMLSQVWMFWAAPIVGAVAGAYLSIWLLED